MFPDFPLFLPISLSLSFKLPRRADAEAEVKRIDAAADLGAKRKDLKAPEIPTCCLSAPARGS